MDFISLLYISAWGRSPSHLEHCRRYNQRGWREFEKFRAVGSLCILWCKPHEVRAFWVVVAMYPQGSAHYML